MRCCNRRCELKATHRELCRNGGFDSLGEAKEDDSPMSRGDLSQPTFVDAMVSRCAKRGAPRRGGLSAPGSVQDPSSAVAHLGAAVEKTWLKSNMRPQGGNRKFLVLGAGTVQIRKGADLFIECAAILKSPPGGDRFQFVWIGDGFDPEYELGYSVYAADQIRRA